MLRRAEPLPDRPKVAAITLPSSVPRALQGAARPLRSRGRYRAVAALWAFFSAALLAAAGRGDELPIAEPTPIAELGPPQSRGAAMQSTADGVTLRVHPSRRSAEVIARWRLRAAPGLLQLMVPSSLRPVTFSISGRAADAEPALSARDQNPSSEAYDELARAGVAVADVVQLEENLPPAPQVRIDPQNASVYTLSGSPAADPAQLSPPARAAHYITVEIPQSGEVTLEARATLSSGFDRKHWRRTHFEQAHALQKRKDPFVYQFAVRGPAGPVAITAAADTAAQVRVIDGVIHASAATRRPPGVGLTVGLGPAIAPPPQDDPASGLLVKGLLRAALDIVLPHRDALALSVEAGSDLQDGHHVGAALVYELYTPAWAYLPIGGHLDVGATCDFWQSRGVGLGLKGAESLRCGGRLGLTANVGFIGIAPSVDIFPPLHELTAGSAETRWTAQYRVAILVTVGL